jgi:hypothetical protein
LTVFCSLGLSAGGEGVVSSFLHERKARKIVINRIAFFIIS